MKKNIDRRNFLKSGVLFGAGSFSSSTPILNKLIPTPPEIEGPFYPKNTENVDDTDIDLTRINDGEVADGVVIYIVGLITDINNEPCDNVVIDLWQANTYGRYRYVNDPNTKAPIDEKFQGWAKFNNQKNGSFTVKTMYPGKYPASENWTRPPHIHYKFSKRTYCELTTQMYFPNEKLNEVDSLYLSKPPTERKTMVAKLIKLKPITYYYKVVLQKVNPDKECPEV